MVVVDDDDDIALLLLTGLERADITAVRARDGDEGVRAVQQEHPVVVLLDWMMPVRDGIHACRDIRADPTIPQPHIIMLTARTQADDQQHALRSGVDEVVSKPFRTREIIGHVKAVLESVH